MPFQPGNKFAKGGARPGTGPKTKQELEAIAKATEVFQKILTGKVEPIAHHYSRRIFKSDQVLLDARKKLWPDLDEHETPQTGDTYIQFNFGIPAGSAPGPGLHNGNGRNLNGGTLHIGGDGGESE